VSRRRSRVLRLRCECGNNVADVVVGTSESIEVKHRAQLLSLPDAPSYAWRCHCRDQRTREHRVRRARLVSAYAAVPRGRVEYRTLGLDL
jgi:hypothetical protein